jgi:hypothetical protein
MPMEPIVEASNMSLPSVPSESNPDVTLQLRKPPLNLVRDLSRHRVFIVIMS